MTNMVERVALALRANKASLSNPEAESLARAAISAMREITPDIDDMHPPMCKKQDFHQSWRAMHDAALARG